eukprot:1191934-Prorocentrum_minimum.AAC.5
MTGLRSKVNALKTPGQPWGTITTHATGRIFRERTSENIGSPIRYWHPDRNPTHRGPCGCVRETIV